MARFLKQPQQQLIQMGSPIDVDFYSRLLEKDQQNRNQAVGMQMEYIDKINNIPIYTEADRAATFGKIQDRLTKMLDKSFITPTQMARTVMELNQEITPGIQALKAKAQAGELYDKMRIQYGANALLGTDPRTLSIKDDKGNFRPLNQFQARGMNMEDIDKNFLQSQTARLTESKGRVYTRGTGVGAGGNGIPVGSYGYVETVGMSPEEITATYGKGSELGTKAATELLETMPEILNIFEGDKDKAVDFLINRNLQTSGAVQQKKNFGEINDIETQLRLQNESAISRAKEFQKIKDEESDYSSVTNPFGPTDSLPSTENPFYYGTAKELSESYSNFITTANSYGADFKDLPTKEEYEKSIKAYKDRYKNQKPTGQLDIFTSEDSYEKATRNYNKLIETVGKLKEEYLSEYPEEIVKTLDTPKKIIDFTIEKDKILQLENPKFTPITGAAKKGIEERLDFNNVNSKGFRTSNDLNIKSFKTIAEDSGYDDITELYKIMKQETPVYIDDTGEFAYTVPVKDGKKVTSKVIYMSGIDDVTQNNSIMLKRARKKAQNENESKVPGNIPTGNYELELNYNGDNTFNLKVKDKEFPGLTFDALSYVMKNYYIKEHMSKTYSEPYIQSSQLRTASTLQESTYDYE